MRHQKVTRYLNNFIAINQLGQGGGYGMCGRNGFSRFPAAEVAGGTHYIACSARAGVGTGNGYSDGTFSGDNGKS